MIGFSAYQTHTALNLHFGKSNYDFFKYNGKTKVNEDSFQKSKFKWQYIGLEKRHDNLLWFFYWCYKNNDFSYTTPQYIFNCSRKMKLIDKQEVIELTRKELIYLSKQYIIDKSDMFKTNGMYPDIYNKYQNKKISLETVLLIDTYISSVFNSTSSDDIIAWPGIIEQMHRVTPFMHEFFDSRQFQELFSASFLNNK